MADGHHRYRPGDRVRVVDGYDGDESAWLAGGTGYDGVIVAMTAGKATVELDDELELVASGTAGWEDFGAGAVKPIREVRTARGRWLVLTHGWVGQTWINPIRLHVGLCERLPDLYAVPPGGGAGYWVESHTAITLLEPAAQ